MNKKEKQKKHNELEVIKEPTQQEKRQETADRIMDEVLSFQFDMDVYQYDMIKRDILALLSYL